MPKDWENVLESDICSRKSLQKNLYIVYHDDKHLKQSKNITN